MRSNYSFIWFSFYMCSLIKILYLHTIIRHVCMTVSCRWQIVLPIARDKYIVYVDLTFSEQNSCCLKAWHAHEFDIYSKRLRDFIPVLSSSLGESNERKMASILVNFPPFYNVYNAQIKYQIPNIKYM